MAVGTSLPSGCYLSVASPPSRDADTGLTMFGWFYVPSFSGYHTTLMLNYATNNVGEGFQFEGTSATQAGGFIMCYPSNYTSLGGTYASGTWYFQAEVFTRSGGVTTRRTYISATAGATPTLIATQTWTAPDASPERFDIGEAETFNRTLRGSLQYFGLAPVAMTTAQLAAQSSSTEATVSCWVFAKCENGVITDSSGNNRTITVTGGTPTASDVSAPVTASISSAVSATAGAPTASASVTVNQPSIGAAVAATAGAPSASIAANFPQPVLTPRVVLYGHSVIAGYGISDPAQHIAPQLKTLLGSRVDTTVVELGYSGETSASLDTNFNTRVSPYVEVGRETILLFTIAFNSAHSGVSSASIMANIWSICSKARALGWKPVVVSETRADADSQAHEETLLAINALMESDWPLHGDGFVDTRERFFDPNDRTLYQEDGAHPTGAGDGVLAGLFYNEVDRILLGASYVQTAAAASTAGAPIASATASISNSAAIAAVAGAPQASAAATVGSAITSTITASAGAPTASASATVGTVLSAAIAATAGAPVASASAVFGQAIMGSLAAVAGAPVASAEATFPEARNAQVSATAGAPAASVEAFVGTDIDAAIASTAGGPVASAFGWIGDFYLDAAISGSAGAPVASSRVYVGNAFPPFTGRTFTDSRSKQCGGRFVVQFAALTDALGNAVDTEAHLHVFANGAQVAVLTRAGGEITYDAEARTYTAMYRQDTPALMRCAWHFPTIEHVGAPIDFPVRGPVLTEPASI